MRRTSCAPKLPATIKTPSITNHILCVPNGETSLIYIDGEFTHAARKHSGDSDFRVQNTWGGTSESCQLTGVEMGVAEVALAQLEEQPLADAIVSRLAA